MRLLIGLIRLGVSLGTLVVAGLAVLALLGFAVPELDLLNHAQVLLFGGALAALVLALLLFGGSRWRRWIIGRARGSGVAGGRCAPGTTNSTRGAASPAAALTAREMASA